MRWLPLLLLFALPSYADELRYRALAYHDVRDDVAGDYDPDQYAVSTQSVIDQFTWLRDNGYVPISIDQLLAAQEGRQSIPDKAVLLTFDDGLASVYTHVYPLLKLFGYPAIVSVVTSWIEMDGSVAYANRERNAGDFLTWDQLREMRASGLVEIASHTHDLHQGIQGNPQGNLQPAAVTRAYRDGRYEDDAEYRARIAADLATSVARIAAELGQPPRIITWPYGAYNDTVASLAAERGMRVSFTLNPKALPRDATVHVRRQLIIANPSLADFSALLIRGPAAPIVRVAQVNLDDLHEVDPLAQRQNLDRLLDRIKALEISHVFLKAFDDDDRDGLADAAYFPNRQLPVRADLFNRVAWQLKTRAEVEVFAWLPMLAYEGDAFDPSWYAEADPDPAANASDRRMRLSTDNADARSAVRDIFEDLARFAQFDGLVFKDDGRAHSLIEFSTDLTAQTRRHIPDLVSVRDFAANADSDGVTANILGSDFDRYLESYDYVALTDLPARESASATKRHFARLVAAVRRRETGLERTIFELTTVEGPTSPPVTSAGLRATLRWLQSLGARHLGYCPDDFVNGFPDLEELRQGISLDEHLMGAVNR